MDKQVFVLEGYSKEGERITCKSRLNEKEHMELQVSGTGDEASVTLAFEFMKQAAILKNSDIPIVMEHDIITEEKIPVLCCFPQSAANIPLVLHVHGFTLNKMMDVGVGIRLAQEGFFAVLPDARSHGERRAPDFDRMFSTENFIENFYKVVTETSEDISTLIDYLKVDPRVDTGRVGMTGFSMGGYITFNTTVRENRIKAAAPVIGSPEWSNMDDSLEMPKIDEEVRSYLKQHEPLAFLDKFPPTALLVQNGLDDQIVPPGGSRHLDGAIRLLYENMPERYKYIEYPGVGHDATPSMVGQMLSWFKKFL